MATLTPETGWILSDGQWGGGYVTDIEYADGFYPPQSPTMMALAATINALETPPASGHFAYCELGCGRGGTSLVLAALNPEAEFHAVDFHPAHIAHGRALARAAGLGNLTFHEVSFADLATERGPPMPLFDHVSMHGVWSWIAPELQQAILHFLDKGLNPGALVHVSFNALPGWTDVAPVQRLTKELAAASPGRSDQSVIQALRALGRLEAAGVIPERFAGAIKSMRDAENGGLAYLAHEYLNEHWRPVYHADVARAFAKAKLAYAASTDLLKNFHNMVLTDAQRQLIAEIPVPELRETLKDFCTAERFRQDVYVRGARRMSARRREALLMPLTLTLTRQPPPLLQISRPDGSLLRPAPEAYQAFMAALTRRPHTVAELLSLPGLPADHRVGPVELVGVLVGVGLATPCVSASPAVKARARRLNDLIDPDEARRAGATVAAPNTGLGVTLNPLHYALYEAMQTGEPIDPAQLAAAFVARCREGGGHPVIDGRVIEDDAEARAEITRDYAERGPLLAPIWEMMGLVE